MEKYIIAKTIGTLLDTFKIEVLIFEF
jgi:hypothetical protein